MELTAAIDKLKLILEETDDTTRQLTDAQLWACLERAGGDPIAAAYYGALQKSRADGMTLPDGTTVQSDREYWLSIAASCRPNRGGVMPRADEADS